MALIGALGLLFGWGSTSPHLRAASSPAVSLPQPTPTTPTTPTTLATTPITEAPTVPETTTTTTPAETTDAFFALFVNALHGDTNFLFDRLHPTVLARYGADQCRAFVAKVLDPAAALSLVQVSGPAPYVWASDGRAATIEQTFTFTANGVAQGATGLRTYHFALVDGRFRIFADCGEALPGGA